MVTIHPVLSTVQQPLLILVLNKIFSLSLSVVGWGRINPYLGSEACDGKSLSFLTLPLEQLSCDHRPAMRVMGVAYLYDCRSSFDGGRQGSTSKFGRSEERR